MRAFLVKSYENINQRKSRRKFWKIIYVGKLNLRSLIDWSDGYVLKLNDGGFGGDVDGTPENYIKNRLVEVFDKLN